MKTLALVVIGSTIGTFIGGCAVVEFEMWRIDRVVSKFSEAHDAAPDLKALDDEFRRRLNQKPAPDPQIPYLRHHPPGWRPSPAN
jgi:hypothetical protein